MTLADKIVVLREGRIEQCGTPKQLYDRPDNLFVAQFIGSPKMNILPVSFAQRLAPDATAPADADKVGVRPEHLTVVNAGASDLVGKVVLSEYTGAVTLDHIGLDAETCLVVYNGESPPQADTAVGLTAKATSLRYFDSRDQAVR